MSWGTDEKNQFFGYPGPKTPEEVDGEVVWITSGGAECYHLEDDCGQVARGYETRPRARKEMERRGKRVCRLCEYNAGEGGEEHPNKSAWSEKTCKKCGLDFKSWAKHIPECEPTRVPCETCERWFDTERAKNIHHTQAHGTPSPAMMLECGACGKHFKRPDDSPGKYCSTRCRSRGSRKRVEVTCEWCRTTKEVTESKAATFRFCKPLCSGKATVGDDTPRCGRCGGFVSKTPENFDATHGVYQHDECHRPEEAQVPTRAKGGGEDADADGSAVATDGGVEE